MNKKNKAKLNKEDELEKNNSDITNSENENLKQNSTTDNDTKAENDKQNELEENLADYVGVKHCISCSSGTDALLIPLMAQGIGTGDAVITTPFTYISTAEVISLLGATPVFCDICPDTYNINQDGLQNAYDNAFLIFIS